MKNLFSIIILALFLTVTIKSQTQVFEDKTDSYVFSSEVQKKFDRFKSKEEIKRWEAGKLKTEISFTKGMIGSLKIFENEFEFEIKKESAKKFNGIVGYWGDIKEGGIILIIGKDREYDFRIWHGECLYRIEWLGDGIHLIEEIDRAVFAKNECKLEGPSNVKSEKINSNNSITSIKTTEPIKIFVAYTPAVAPDINYLIEYCELVTKSSFENSSISSDIEIVGSQQLAYTESTDATTDLNRFVSINDGYLDEIHSLRNEYQADVCVLIVDSLLGVNGLAASIGAEYSTAFFVVNASATLEDLSFSHELGHLLGCRHDNDIGTLPYGNARGYDWYGKLLEYSNNLKKYKTIMSIKEGSELRVPFFSNPYVNDDGSNPIGTLQYNYAAYAIDDYSSTIAAFQPRYTTSGTISVNEWWRGTLNITGNVTINSGVKLTIEPNATINFSSGASLIINGELIANGATLTNSGTWGGIQFNSGSTGNIYNCIITNATNGIYCYNSSPTIRNSILEYNNTGLSCSYYSSPVLRLNSFRYNSINGISCNSNSSPDLGEDENSGSNAIRNNLIGLKTSYNSNPDLHGYMVYGNSVFDNTGNEIEATYYCTINADRVFWGNGATIFPYSSTVTNTNPLQYNPNPFQSIIEKSEPNQILSKIEAINTDQPQDELTEALYKQREKI